MFFDKYTMNNVQLGGFGYFRPYYSVYKHYPTFIYSLMELFNRATESFINACYNLFVNTYALFEVHNKIELESDIYKLEEKFVEKLEVQQKEQKEVKYNLMEVADDGDCMFHSLIAASPANNPIKQEDVASLRQIVSNNLNEIHKMMVLLEFKDSLENTGFRGLGTENFRTNLRNYFFEPALHNCYDKNKVLSIIKVSLGEEMFEMADCKNMPMFNLLQMLNMDTPMNAILKDNISFEEVFERNADAIWEMYKQEVEKVGGIWGDQIMMKIIADEFNLKVITHSTRDNSVVEAVCSEQNNPAEVHLQYTGRHYSYQSCIR